jgi:hypothetical protein
MAKLWCESATVLRQPFVAEFFKAHFARRENSGRANLVPHLCSIILIMRCVGTYIMHSQLFMQPPERIIYPPGQQFWQFKKFPLRIFGVKRRMLGARCICIICCLNSSIFEHFIWMPTDRRQPRSVKNVTLSYIIQCALIVNFYILNNAKPLSSLSR